MMSALGGRELDKRKEDVVREVVWVQYCISVPNVDRGGGCSKNLKIMKTSFKYGPDIGRSLTYFNFHPSVG